MYGMGGREAHHRQRRLQALHALHQRHAQGAAAGRGARRGHPHRRQGPYHTRRAAFLGAGSVRSRSGNRGHRARAAGAHLGVLGRVWQEPRARRRADPARGHGRLPRRHRPRAAARDGGLPARQPVRLLPEGGREVTPTQAPKRITDIGPPHYEKFLHPLIKRNYGQWRYHETLAPGVLCHVAESGERIYTVRAGSPRLLSMTTIRLFASLADKSSGGSRGSPAAITSSSCWTMRPTSRRSNSSSRKPASRWAAPTIPSATWCTRRAGSTATRPPPTPPASSRP